MEQVHSSVGVDVRSWCWQKQAAHARGRCSELRQFLSDSRDTLTIRYCVKCQCTLILNTVLPLYYDSVLYYVKAA